MAGKLDVSRQQYASYERGDTEISPSRLGQIAKELQVPTSEIVRRAETPPAAAPTREWSTIYKPFEVRQKLPPRAYERVYGYLERLQAADIPLDMIEEVERLMVDPLYSKINKREIRERSEEDLIIDIDAAWLWVKEIVEREWGKSLK